MMLTRLNEVNDVVVYPVSDPCFKTYGRVITGYDFEPVIRYLEENTAVPESGNVYMASVPELESLSVADEIKHGIYGAMEIQIGYCNGRNTTYNGFEYHKGSEINVAATDFMLVLGHTWDVLDGMYRAEEARVFFVERGTAIEMYQTTLHLSPCRVREEGFKDVVILPRGTNTPLEEKAEIKDGEEKLLLQKNKWVTAHPQREPLIRQGAFAGVLGDNKELFY